MDVGVCLQQHSIRKNFKFRFTKNDSERVTAKCVTEGYPWYFRSYRSNDNKATM